MAERRKLGQAFQITPEKLAFIQGNDAKTETAEAPKQEPKTVDVEIKDRQPELPSEPKARTQRRARGRAESVALNAGELLDEVLVPVTIRVPRRTAQALRTANLEQRLQNPKATQQRIVEEALSDWLYRQGFLQ